MALYPKVIQPEEYLCDHCEKPATRIRFVRCDIIESPIVDNGRTIQWEDQTEVDFIDSSETSFDDVYLCDDCED